MATYFVEGTIKINIDIDVEADSLEDAERKAFEIFKEENTFHNYVYVVEDLSGLMAGEYEDEEYKD